MKTYQIMMIGLLGSALLLPVNATAYSPQAPQPDNTKVNERDRKPGAKTSDHEPDNTRVNERDRKHGAKTADQQKMNKPDRELTAKIRRAVIADKMLSTNGHNVKIVTVDGMVTLKGPVKSDAEMKSILAKATEITGSEAKVMNEMSVMPDTKHEKE